MDTRAKKRVRLLAESNHQHNTAVATAPSSTHLLSLPNHLITSLILPRVSSPGIFCATCKAAQSLSSTHSMANWLQFQRPATALHLAAKSKASDALILELLERPGMLEGTTRYYEGYSLLFWAADTARSQVVRRLLQLRMDPNDPGLYNNTPLMAASYNGRTAVVAELVQAEGIEVAKGYFNGNTALHEAAGGGSVEVIRMLIQAGDSVNVRNAFGCSPLHFACEEGRTPAVSELLQHAGDPTLQNDIGETPLDIARANGCDEIVAILEQHARSSL